MIKAYIKNFIEKELACRCCGLFNYDDNFLVRLQAFRILLGYALIVSCGCRCVKHNEDVGGVETSLHQCETKPACAVDVTGKDLEYIYNLACISGLFNEVIFYKDNHFIHLGWDKNQQGNYFKIKG